MRWPAVCVVGILLAAFPRGAGAHAQYRPFSLNRYLLVEFDSETVRLTYDLTIGDIPAQEMRLRADDNGDGRLSAEELDAIRKWLQGLLDTGFTLRLDEAAQSLAWQSSIEGGEPQVATFSPMRFRFRVALPCPAGWHRMLISDRAQFPALEQTELLLAEGPYVEHLTAHRARQAQSQTHVFWNGGERLEPVEVRWLMRRQPRGENFPATSLPTWSDEMSSLKRALAGGRLGFTGWLGAILLALVLGAWHALSPGHGKSLAVAYLLGSQARVRHAVILGLVVTLAHVASVVALGLVALWAAEKVLPERLAPWLELASGSLVLLLGVVLLFRRLHDRHHHPHHHHESLPALRAEIRWGDLLALGLSGGMVPCPAALVVLLFAIYSGRLIPGLLLIAAFSLGLALTLVAVSILAVCARKLFCRWTSGKATQRAMTVLPLASAAFVSALGAVMVGLALTTIL